MLYIALTLSVVGVVGLIAHFATFRVNVLIGVAALSPYLMAALPLAAVLFAAGRQWFGLVAAAALTVVVLLTQAPLYVAAAAPGSGRTIVMLTTNLKLGQGDPTALVALVRRHDVDIVAAEELTPAERNALAGAGLDRVLPYSVVDPRERAAGVGLWSRYPLTAEQNLQSFTFAFVSAQVTIPGSGKPVTIAAAHLPGPWPQPAEDWVRDIAKLPATLHALAAGGGPVLVGGDFNATPDVAQFRRLLAGGYHDSAAQAGAGMTRTYPADTWFPPLIAIDHVLSYGATARKAETVPVPGSDHRGLLVTVQLPA